jgi:hypothetical protein
MSIRSAAARSLAPALLVSVVVSTLAAPPLPFPAVLELSSLNGDNGFVLNGIDAADLSGESVSSAGDINNDGIDDLIIGAAGGDPVGGTSGGETYIVFGTGAGFGPSLDLSTLDGTNGFAIFGFEVGGRSGESVSAAGDVNGDGIDDVIIGDPSVGPLSGGYSSGRSYVVFGKDTAATGPFASTLDLSTLDGTNGFAFRGSGNNSGRWVSSAGDINGDGVDDVVIASRSGPTHVSRFSIVFGRNATPEDPIPFPPYMDASILDGTHGFLIQCIDWVQGIECVASCAGDVNGDGVDDLVIGESGADPDGRTNAGRAYVVYGRRTTFENPVPFPSSIHLATLDGTTGFVLNGIDSFDHSGESVSGAGDVNGDGIDDLIIGALGADSWDGESYVVFGRNAGVDGPFPAVFELSALDGTNGYIIDAAVDDVRFGCSVSGAGDLNSDGTDDLVIGARDTWTPWQRSGKTYVVFGGPGVGATGLVVPSAFTGTDGFAMPGVNLNDGAGTSVSAAGDFNGDGASDIIIGAPGADQNGQNSAGASYVVFGRAPEPCSGDINSDGFTNAADFVILAGNFGASVSPNTNGDLNGDGLVNSSDFVILAGDFGCGS